MEKPTHSLFTRAKLNVTQILTFWLVITLKWNTQVVLLLLKLLLFPSKGEWAGIITQSLFARAKLSVTQILTFWLVITLKWITQVVLLLLKLLLFPSKWEWVGNVPVYRQQLVSSTAVVYNMSNSCNVKLWPFFIYLINYGDVLYIF